MPSTLGKLWIVATPLGNPGDMSPRAASILANVDLILAEDTRRGGILLKSLGIQAKKLESFFEHNELEKTPAILELLQNGSTVALITDAGTPLLADPGYRLVKKCREEGIAVSPAPGPSAPVAALSTAGFPPVPFSFLGFLPRKASEIRKLLASYANLPGSLVFFERKNRVANTLKLAGEVLGSRPWAICRELTKTHEEFIFGRLNAGNPRISDLLGEITIIIGPCETPGKTSRDMILEKFAELSKTGKKPREIAKLLGAEVTGWSIAEIYNMTRER